MDVGVLNFSCSLLARARPTNTSPRPKIQFFEYLTCSVVHHCNDSDAVILSVHARPGRK